MAALFFSESALRGAPERPTITPEREKAPSGPKPAPLGASAVPCHTECARKLRLRARTVNGGVQPITSAKVAIPQCSLSGKL